MVSSRRNHVYSSLNAPRNHQITIIEMVSSRRNHVYSSLNAPRNHQITIWEKLVVSRGRMSLSHWKKKIELGERKRKQLLLKDIFIGEDSFYI
jgi:hypothetical protein